mgnify:CR=1 FL=1
MKVNISDLSSNLVKLSMSTQSITDLPQITLNGENICYFPITTKELLVKNLMDVVNNLIKIIPQEANIEFIKETKEKNVNNLIKLVPQEINIEYPKETKEEK